MNAHFLPGHTFSIRSKNYEIVAGITCFGLVILKAEGLYADFPGSIHDLEGYMYGRIREYIRSNEDGGLL